MRNMSEGCVEGVGAELLGAAETWSEAEVEAGCQRLLESIHSLLADEETSPELRYPVIYVPFLYPRYVCSYLFITADL